MYLQHMIFDIGRSCTKKGVWRDRNHSVPDGPYYVIRPEGESARASSGAGENEGARGRPSAPGKARVQAREWGDDMRDSGRMCVSGEVRANEGARAMRVGARERGRRRRHVRVWRTRVNEGGQVGEGVG